MTLPAALPPPGTTQTLDPLQWDFVGKNLFVMAAEGVIFFIFTILLQYKFFIRFRCVEKKNSLNEHCFFPHMHFPDIFPVFALDKVQTQVGTLLQLLCAKWLAHCFNDFFKAEKINKMTTHVHQYSLNIQGGFCMLTCLSGRGGPSLGCVPLVQKMRMLPGSERGSLKEQPNQTFSPWSI